MEVSLDLLMEGKHDIGPYEELHYYIGGWGSYSRYKEWQGNLKELAIELVAGKEQPLLFNAVLGRQFFSDPTENIVAQSLDGLNTSFKTDIIDAHLGLGYLGFFPANHSSIILSTDDEIERTLEDWGTAPQRLLVLGDLSFALTTISLGLHFGSQFDLRQSPIDYGYTSWYVGLHSNGFVFELLQYTFQSTLSGGHFTSTTRSSYWGLAQQPLDFHLSRGRNRANQRRGRFFQQRRKTGALSLSPAFSRGIISEAILMSFLP